MQNVIRFLVRLVVFVAAGFLVLTIVPTAHPIIMFVSGAFLGVTFELAVNEAKRIGEESG